MIPAERGLLEATGGSIVTGGGLAFHPGLSESGQARPVNGQPSSEASIRKSILVADGQASASDENESRQGGENDDGAQYVYHVHGCRLSFFVTPQAARVLGFGVQERSSGRGLIAAGSHRPCGKRPRIMSRSSRIF